MFRYAHSTQTGQSRLVSILQNIRRTNIDRLAAISYQIPVVDNTSRTRVHVLVHLNFFTTENSTNRQILLKRNFLALVQH